MVIIVIFTVPIKLYYFNVVIFGVNDDGWLCSPFDDDFAINCNIGDPGRLIPLNQYQINMSLINTCLYY